MTLKVFLVLALVTLLQSGKADPSRAPGRSVDEIVVVKSEHKMTLMSHGVVLRTYQVALSTLPAGAKQRSGDHKVPEGEYRIDYKNPGSQFHLALHVSYPNAEDRARAQKLGVDPGGEIEIHGLADKYAWLGSMHRKYDWTNGCIAVTNAEIEEIYPMVQVGTKLEIKP
jgi:murein L,D-transpeptidase YafK